MDPFSMIIGITIAAYVVGGVAADTWAVATRQTPPSIQKARERHERKLARGEHSNPAPSYFGRILGNAAERWAERSDQRHRAKLQWIDEQGPRRGQRWLQRKRKRAERYEQAAQKIAAKTGQVWTATKDAVENTRERRRGGTDADSPEGTASDADQSGTGAESSTESSGAEAAQATVLKFRRRQDPDETSSGSESPRSRDELIQAWRTAVGSGESQEVMTAEEWNSLEEATRKQLIAEARAAGFAATTSRVLQETSGSAAEPDPDQTSAGDQNGPKEREENGETRMANQTEQTSTATDTGEITSLTDAKGYTRSMSQRLAAIQAESEGMGAQLNALAANARASAQEIEQAIADLGGHQVQGNHVTALSQSAEDLGAMAEAARAAAKQVATVSESATTAQTGFNTAHRAFAAQTGLEEEIQTANASGNRAGRREFYENA